MAAESRAQNFTMEGADFYRPADPHFV